MSLEELRKAIKEKKLVYGANRALKLLRMGKISNIFIAANYPNPLKEEIKKLSSIGGITIHELKETNQELGTHCKKTFSISIACY